MHSVGEYVHLKGNIVSCKSIGEDEGIADIHIAIIACVEYERGKGIFINSVFKRIIG